MISNVNLILFDKQSLDFNWENVVSSDDFRLSEGRRMLNSFLKSREEYPILSFYNNFFEDDLDNDLVNNILNKILENKSYTNIFKQYFLYYKFLLNDKNLWYFEPSYTLTTNIRAILAEKSVNFNSISTYSGLFENEKKHFYPIYYGSDKDIIGDYFKIDKVDFEELLNEVSQPFIENEIKKLDMIEQTNYKGLIKLLQYQFKNQNSSLLVVKFD